MLRAALILLVLLLVLLPISAPSAHATEARNTTQIENRLASIEGGDADANAALKKARTSLPECKAGCITADEATVMAFSLPEGEAQSGRFLLDIRGGGQSLQGELEEMFFVNSRQDYATLGTLTIAFERDALRALLQRAKVCGAAIVKKGEINVRGCRSGGVSDLNMFTMMQRLGGRRIVVDGEVRLQWIDSHIGAPRPIPNKRGEHEMGYYQVWVRVADADQVIFVYDD